MILVTQSIVMVKRLLKSFVGYRLNMKFDHISLKKFHVLGCKHLNRDNRLILLLLNLYMSLTCMENVVA